MPRGTKDKPVVTKPTLSTLEAYKDRVVKVTDHKETEHVGRLAVVNAGVVVLHFQREGKLAVKGVFVEHIESIQEVQRSAMADADEATPDAS